MSATWQRFWMAFNVVFAIYNAVLIASQQTKSVNGTLLLMTLHLIYLAAGIFIYQRYQGPA